MQNRMVHISLVYILCGLYLTIVICDNISFRLSRLEKLERGNSCIFKRNNSLGQCTNAAECPAALRDFRELNLAPTPCIIKDQTNMTICCHGELYTDYEEPPSVLIESPIKNSQRKSAACELKINILFVLVLFLSKFDSESDCGFEWF